MARYIDAELLEPDTEWDDYEDCYISYSYYQIRCAKTADVRENIKAYWKNVNDEYYSCSYCGGCADIAYHYCPWCGADMRGEA